MTGAAVYECAVIYANMGMLGMCAHGGVHTRVRYYCSMCVCAYVHVHMGRSKVK